MRLKAVWKIFLTLFVLIATQVAMSTVAVSHDKSTFSGSTVVSCNMDCCRSGHEGALEHVAHAGPDCCNPTLAPTNHKIAKSPDNCDCELSPNSPSEKLPLEKIQSGSSSGESIDAILTDQENLGVSPSEMELNLEGDGYSCELRSHLRQESSGLAPPQK